LLFFPVTLTASFEKRFTYKKLDYFLIVENKELDVLEGDNLVYEAAKNIFDLFRRPMVLLTEEVLSCF